MVLAGLTAAQTITLKLDQGGIATIRYDASQVCTRSAAPNTHTPQDNPALQRLLPLNITDPMEEEAEYADAVAAATPVRPQDLLDAALGMPPHTAPPSPCDALLRIPKVALMFLTPGALAHERLWSAFFSSVTGAVPASLVQDVASDGWFGSLRRDRLAALQRTCGAQAADTQRGLVDRQFLFSLHVHHHPRYAGYPPESLFHQRVIPVLMDAERYAGVVVSHNTTRSRAHHSLTDAERLLLAEALRQPLNQRFVLVSETTLPLYSGPLLYAQAMAETHSRLQGCYGKDTLLVRLTWKCGKCASATHQGNLERWDPRMETPRFSQQHWRKTSQWFSVTRRHAAALVSDREVNDAFERFCKPHTNEETGLPITCSSNV